MKKNHLTMLFGLLVMALFVISCENNLEITLPQGPQGEKGDKGDKGDPGKSAFELWIEFYGKDPNTSIEEFFNSLKGQDGKDGAVPIIGENGNWIIDGEDTGIPARGRDGANGVTPVIGENGNWFIGGQDTGVPARGADGADGANGVNGKSAYELWKEAVELCDGSVTNKDGSDYDCTKSSWEDFLIWLQGGDMSVLHRYWVTLPGNEGKTIWDFIEELFDCHCDGIVVSMISEPVACVELNPDGTLKETYNAVLRVGGEGGTQVQVTGTGVNLSGTITDGTTPLLFSIARGDESIELAIACTNSGNTVTKYATVPALDYVKLAGTATVTQVPGEESDEVVIEFLTAPSSLSINGEVVFENGSIVPGSGWTVSNEGKTFTGRYDRTETEQCFTVQATGGDGACSTIEHAFHIPQLAPVEMGVLNLSVVDDCFLLLTFTGTPGMTVTAMDFTNHDNAVVLAESPAGTYSTSLIPRLYDGYTILVRAELAGYGTVEETIEIDGTNLAPIANPLTIDLIAGEVENTSIVQVKRRLTNHTGGALTVQIIRSANSATGALQYPDDTGYPQTGVVPANSYVDVTFYRDYTETLAAGEYLLTFLVTTACGIQSEVELTIENQQYYRHSFALPPEWGDGTGDPNQLITFEVSIQDGIPGSYVEFQLFNGVAYGGVSREQLDDTGSLTWNVTMTRAQIQAALDNQNGFFYFFSDSGYTAKYSIGADKEEVTFAFD